MSLSVPSIHAFQNTPTPVAYFYISNHRYHVMEKRDYNIVLKKDGKFYVGYCLEIPQARGQGNSKEEAIQDTKKAIKLCRSYLEGRKKASPSRVVTVSV